MENFKPTPIPDHIKNPPKRKAEFEGKNPKLKVEDVGATTVSILDVPELQEFSGPIPKDILNDIPRCPVNKMMVEIITTGNTVLSLPDDNGDWWVVGLYDGRLVKRETREQIFLKQQFILDRGAPTQGMIKISRENIDAASRLILPERPASPVSPAPPSTEDQPGPDPKNPGKR